jgi:hypothetical protein
MSDHERTLAAYARGRADGYDNVTPAILREAPEYHIAYQSGYSDGQVSRRVFERRVASWEGRAK